MNNYQFKIIPVTTEFERQIFLDIPARVYQNDPNWVAPIRSSIVKQLARNNPFFEYGELQEFIAITTEGEPLGRIVAAINQRLIQRENQQIGLFGYFECVNNFEVAQMLLETACQWLRDRQITLVRGPIDLSTHNNCLFLLDGFNFPPTIMMPYNPSYYPEFMEKADWQKAKDAYAYNLSLDQPLASKFERGYKIACKSGITFRSIRLKKEGFKLDIHSLYYLFNTAFTNNWSSTPRTESEFVTEANNLQKLVDPDIFIIAEDRQKMIGFFMGLPDYNIPLKYVNGRLNWLGIIKFILNKNKIDRGRIIAICSLPEYRQKMIPLALVYLGMQGGTRKNKLYKNAELSWVWEDNYPSRNIIEASGGKIYKTYRIYEKLI